MYDLDESLNEETFWQWLRSDAVEHEIRTTREACKRWLDQTPGQVVLDVIFNGDPSHSSWQGVNTLREKAAAVAGTLLFDPKDVHKLPIPDILKKSVSCWHHDVYRHRYKVGHISEGPDGCTACCKEPNCRACC